MLFANSRCLAMTMKSCLKVQLKKQETGWLKTSMEGIIGLRCFLNARIPNAHLVTRNLVPVSATATLDMYVGGDTLKVKALKKESRSQKNTTSARKTSLTRSSVTQSFVHKTSRITSQKTLRIKKSSNTIPSSFTTVSTTLTLSSRSWKALTDLQLSIRLLIYMVGSLIQLKIRQEKWFLFYLTYFQET